jgi:hypothetical protein
MAWREAFLIWFGGGAFSGITLGRWLRVLGENRFAVDMPYWGRAAVITLSSSAASGPNVCRFLGSSGACENRAVPH